MARGLLAPHRVQDVVEARAFVAERALHRTQAHAEALRHGGAGGASHRQQQGDGAAHLMRDGRRGGPGQRLHHALRVARHGRIGGRVEHARGRRRGRRCRCTRR